MNVFICRTPMKNQELEIYVIYYFIQWALTKLKNILSLNYLEIWCKIISFIVLDTFMYVLILKLEFL